MNASYIVTIQTAVEIFFRPIFGFAITKIQNPNNILLYALAALLLASTLFLNWFIEIINGGWSVLIAFSILQGAAFAFCGGLPTGLQEWLINYYSLPWFSCNLRISWMASTTNSFCYFHDCYWYFIYCWPFNIFNSCWLFWYNESKSTFRNSVFSC